MSTQKEEGEVLEQRANDGLLTDTTVWGLSENKPAFYEVRNTPP